MFGVILSAQWKWSRMIVMLGTAAAFLLPILSVQGASGDAGSPVRPGEILSLMQSWGVLYPVLAAGLGLLVAIVTWAPDHRGRHVHALSLPLPRWKYVLFRFTAGLVLLATPVVALLAGALLATRFTPIPVGLQGYPLAMALRFGLAVLIAYAAFFAISAGTTRTAGIILAVLAGLIVVQVLASAASLDLDLVTRIQTALMNWPGPLAIFTGRWMLIDV